MEQLGSAPGEAEAGRKRGLGAEQELRDAKAPHIGPENGHITRRRTGGRVRGSP